MAQLLVHLPEELILRLKRAVPSRQRSRFVPGRIETALPAEEQDEHYEAALAVEGEETLATEMEEWEEATVGDGLGRRE